MTENETRLSETTPATPDPFVGRTFDGLRVESVIGKGGMGVVYKATQLSLNRPVALKILPEDVSEHPQFVERFHREVDILSRLSHPNVVTVFDRGEVDGRLYLVMELVEGTSLREEMLQGPLGRERALLVVRSILAALEHAHDRGVVHRDIKPENVLVAPGGIVKVADFGLSRIVRQEETRLTHTQLMLGTFEYMSPEQREKAKAADERSDLYATGVVFYEMLTGELPIGRFKPLSVKRPKECDARIDKIVEKSLEKEPQDRYQRASEMGGAISKLLTPAPVGEPVVAPVVAMPPVPQPVPAARPSGARPQRRRRSSIPLWPFVLGGLVVLGGPVVVFVLVFLSIRRSAEEFDLKPPPMLQVERPRRGLAPRPPDESTTQVHPMRELLTRWARGIDLEIFRDDHVAQDWISEVAAVRGAFWRAIVPVVEGSELYLTFDRDRGDPDDLRRIAWGWAYVLEHRYGLELNNDLEPSREFLKRAARLPLKRIQAEEKK